MCDSEIAVTPLFSRIRSSKTDTAVKLRHTHLSIPVEAAWLDARLAHAPDVVGLAVLLEQGGGSFSRTGSEAIESYMQGLGYATLVANLLTRYEIERDPDACFNVPQMANRLIGIRDWIEHQPPLSGLGVGVLAARTGSAVAIRAAWKAPTRFHALVCLGGRPDLAGATPLQALTTPLCIAIGAKDPYFEMVGQAFERIRCDKHWQVLEGCDGSLEGEEEIAEFGQIAHDWLLRHLPAPMARTEVLASDAGTSTDDLPPPTGVHTAD